MHLANSERQEKLAALREAEGFATIEAMLETTAFDSVSPAICINCNCTAEMEPDQDRGHCEGCGQNTVVSALVLAGVI
ncbi:MAG: hypothetical protein RLT05_06215 [Bauldia litoralis]